MAHTTDPAQGFEPGAKPPAPADEYSDGPVSLKPLLNFFVAYRRVLALAGLAAIAVWAVVILILAFVLPTERTGSIHLRFLFDGAADGKYPNSTVFSPAELIATPVLSEVYRANDLQRFGTYGDFKDSMAILQTSLEQELLSAAYSARLADPKLTPTDRARLEDEFRKQREAIRDPVFALTMRRSERLRSLPPALMEKALNDALAGWAQQAKDVKGATRFDVPILSPDFLRPEMLQRDYLMAADDLRLQARRAADVARRLQMVPGAVSLRSQKERFSLSDVSFAIADTLRNEIDPTIYFIQNSGLTNDAGAVAQYLHGQVVELRLERDAAHTRIQSLQEALGGYMSGKGARPRDGSAGAGTSARPQGLETQTLIPQMSDTFLDRLIEMSTQTQAKDVEYRQRLTDELLKEGAALAELDRGTAYYEQLEKALQGSTKPASAAQAQAVKARLQSAFDALRLSIQRLITLYEELSEQRLNPSMLYAVTRPFALSTNYALTWGRAALIFGLVELVALAGALAWSLSHNSAARRAARTR